LSNGTSNFYIKNTELVEEIEQFKINGKASERLGKMLLTLATNFSTKGNFSGYTWRNDMISEAVLVCLKYVKNFDSKKSSNAFSYITSICHNSFKAYIKSQNKHSKIKNLCFHIMECGLLDDSCNKIIAIDYEDMKFMDDEPEKLVEEK
jgi:hypothetical protein